MCGISRQSEKWANVWPHMSTLHSSSNCILRAPWWHGNAGKKRKYWHVWPTYQHMRRQHLPLHDIISFFRDSRCDSWLFAYQSERAVDQEWCHSLRAAPQCKQRLRESLFETAISDRVYPNDNFIQHSSFFLLQLCLRFPFFFFLPPSSRRCVTSARPCLMSYFFGWLWITVSAESSNLERRHSGVARKATYASPPAKKRFYKEGEKRTSPVNLPELHFCSLESCPNINMMCQPS